MAVLMEEKRAADRKLMAQQKVIKDAEKAEQKEKDDFWRLQKKEMKELAAAKEEKKANSDGEIEDDFW